jgi:hypothetical protein
VTTLIVPEHDVKPWPTLGPYVCRFLEERSVFGPGSLKGLPYKLDREKRLAVYKAYEIYPRGHAWAGRRRFQRVGISWRKGTAKTEWAAQIAFVELHPDGPVRFAGWNDDGTPKQGRPVRDPYIPLMAYTEDQTEELAYGALRVICSEGPDADFFDIGLDRILRIDVHGYPDGKAVAVAGSPNAADGARTTFEHFDETHRLDLPRLVRAHGTMLENLPKRPLDDPWALETTTAGRPGGGSVAEVTHKEALAIQRGEIKDPTLFYFHREASAKHNLKTLEGRIEAVREATGPVGEYAPGQFAGIARGYDRPGVDKTYWERVWTNRWTRSDSQAFDVDKFEKLGDVQKSIPPGALCTLGFDGARFRDSTGIVLTEVATGFQEPFGLWERPENADADWQVPEDDVLQAFSDAFDDYEIWRGYFDPPHWQEEVGKLAGERPDQVVEWWTHRRRPMAQAVRAFKEGIDSGQLTHNGDPDYVRHVGNAGRQETNLLDEEGNRIVILMKIRPEAKFDLCMAGVLSWQARLDALAAGAGPTETFIPYRIR